MTNPKRKAGLSFMWLGLIFLIIGFVLQDFSFSFESGLFNLGLIFTLSGLVATALSQKPDNS